MISKLKAKVSKFMQRIRSLFGAASSDEGPFSGLQVGVEAYLDSTPLIRRFKLVSRGREDGVRNLPAPAANIESEAEQQVHHATELALGRLQKNAAKYFEEMKPSLNRLLAHPLKKARARFVEEVRREVDLTLDRYQPELVQQCAQANGHERHFRKFREDNRLMRAAEARKPLLLSIGVLLICAIIESYSNSALLAQYRDGWLSAWALAIGLALANVLFSFLLGYGLLRYVNHVKWWKRITAFVLFAVGAIIVLIYNAAIGQYRSLLERAGEEAASVNFNVALNSVLQGQLDFQSPESFLLMFLGVLGALLAIIDGYCWIDDRYPGYGLVTRNAEKARQILESSLQDLETELASKAAQKVENFDRDVGMALDLEERFSQLDQAYRAMAWQMESALTSALRAYREANESVRSAEPPRYFELYPDLAGREWLDAAQAAMQCADIGEEGKHLSASLKDELERYLRDKHAWLRDDYLANIEGKADELMAIDSRVFYKRDLKRMDLHEERPTAPRAAPAGASQESQSASELYDSDLFDETPLRNGAPSSKFPPRHDPGSPSAAPA